MPSYTRVDEHRRTLCTERGAAQGRPLSPALPAILLQPCIIAAEDAMMRQMGVTREQFGETCGIAAYFAVLRALCRVRLGVTLGIRPYAQGHRPV